MECLPRRDYGLTHGDYRPGNVVWDGQVARTIDFDEPNFHWLIADVARALMELRDLPLARRRRHREEFLRGYRAEREIEPFRVGQLPYFVQHRALLMRAWDLQEGGSWREAEAWSLERVGW